MKISRDTAMSRTALFLFGAGASADSGDCSPEPPPLGNNLFRSMEAGGFISNRQGLPPECLSLFGETGGFERGMACLAQQTSREYNPFLRDMARFFCRFQPGGRNAYVRLFRWLLSLKVRFVVSTLNYENLIEHAFVRLHMRVKGDGGAVNGLEILKPHGSCGFLPDIGESILQVQFRGFETDIECDCRVDLRRDQIERWCTDPRNEALAPVMSFFTERKDTRINRRYIAAHREKWAESVRDCATCFIVGVRCNPQDIHIWDVLAGSRCRLVFVNPDVQGFNEWAESKGRIETSTVIAKGFRDAIPDIVHASMQKWERSPADD